MEAEPVEPADGERWLLLIHQLPAKPAYLRVKVWRRLQALGAVPVKNAVHILPATAEAQEDFAWLRREIVDGSGEAMVCEARFVDGLSDREIRELFRQARDADYHALADEARALAAGLEAQTSSEHRAEAQRQLARLKTHLGQVVAIDFFGASGREAVAGLLGGLERELAGAEEALPPPPPPACGRLEDRIWVTRQGVQVDRIASAWLIRRFIDPKARFEFVPPKGYAPQPRELRFDMFEAEFTHQGDRCTFEVLLGDVLAEDDPALQMIAEIVHDIDLKDGKFGHSETEGIRTMIAALCAACDDDAERLRRGAALLDDLYGYFQRPGR
ncbi:MAG: ChrB protein [Geminicoccaceae bacterium]|nr:ChrB protein [Geminicoccaceae bacterium]